MSGDTRKPRRKRGASTRKTEPGIVAGGGDTAGGETGEFSFAGQLLVATTVLTEQPFAQSVILLCAHSSGEGAMGIIVNKPAHAPGFSDLLGQLGVEPMPPLRELELCSGGPCETSRGFVLHSTDWQGDGSLVIDETMSLTASLDVLKAIATGAGPKLALLALGHASWSPGQLEREMEENAWLTIAATEPIVFGQDHGTKWRRALAGLGIEPILLSGRAGHA